MPVGVFATTLLPLSSSRRFTAALLPIGNWCTRITHVRRPAVVARGSLEATTLQSVAGGAGGRELLPRCYQTIPNHADIYAVRRQSQVCPSSFLLPLYYHLRHRAGRAPQTLSSSRVRIAFEGPRGAVKVLPAPPSGPLLLSAYLDQ